MARLAVLSVLLWTQSGAAQTAPYRGESCARCHAAIRDAQPVKPAVPGAHDGAGEERDVVIVGGGISGLTAAYALRGADVLILEKEDRVGGKVAVDGWGGRGYTVGAGYIGEPYLDEVKGMLSDLAVPPTRIPEPQNRLQSEISRFLSAIGKDMGALANDPHIGELPPMPAPENVTTFQRGLDRLSFSDYMRKRYGLGAARFADQYCMSLFGARAKNVSALAGLVFFSSDFGGSANVTWPQGPGALTEKLAQRIGADHLRTGAFVTAVSSQAKGVDVVYERDGKRSLVRAKAVVMAVPSLVAKRIVLGLPQWKRRALARVRYSSYAVAIVALDASVDVGAWDFWSGGKTVFTDLEPLDWPFRADISSASVGAPAQLLKVYVPLGESEGRARMLTTTDEDLAAKVAADLEKILPAARGRLHGVRIIRFGHAMPVDYPGYLTELRALVAKPVGRIVFAGVDTEMPCIEGAVVSGYRAAREVRALLPASAHAQR